MYAIEESCSVDTHSQSYGLSAHSAGVGSIVMNIPTGFILKVESLQHTILQTRLDHL